MTGKVHSNKSLIATFKKVVVTPFLSLNNSQESLLWDQISRHYWRLITCLFWILTAAFLLYTHRHAIYWLSLSDTDDNLRLAEVRDWLHGQGWFDLQQHRLNPPKGANIHWSRLVDIPIAALIAISQPFLGSMGSIRFGTAIAPLLPLGILFFGNALTCRRLVGEKSFFVANCLLLCAGVTLGMFLPLRIDHHGWQLAFLSLIIAGNADPDRKRGAVTVALSSTLSLVIGLEILPYIALAAGMQTLFWVTNIRHAQALKYYGFTLALTSLIGWLIFASYANRAPVCDALSPVWLTATIGGGLLVALIASIRAGWAFRLSAAVIAGLFIGGIFAYSWPQCLGRPEAISPELYKLWMSHVGEAKPVYSRDIKVIVLILSLPIVGLISLFPALWNNRFSPRIGGWLNLAFIFLSALAMTAWQTRTSPAAQLLAVPACCWLIMTLLKKMDKQKTYAGMLGYALVILSILAVASSFIPLKIVEYTHQGHHKPFFKNPFSKGSTLPSHRAEENHKVSENKTPSHPERRCPTIPALKSIEAIPQANILTFIDFAPRLIAMTHHQAIAGPYHRNADAILDVHHAFRGSPEQAENIIRRHAISLVLICPGMPESSIYLNEAKNGFYAQLAKGQVPPWLEAMPLPKESPFRLWRVKAAANAASRQHN
ncbi:hypothetical protein [Zymomonas mobilis]|uniref:AcrB/AcrD/AcrF family protein n=1 Tax=Zymomonas mobilis subsp. mobilis (strain ATCC 10988 / DSM 424 / LMG 404 / NCIMB 8938 / NRRL B-806 / ZM1) TaxID=555217 RepID=A0A0H3FYL4_ZYMMA|nr:hypothetical protein [Zymomonas mobilis]AEH62860.1 conserved hypothetical protein [Zymomonas mobilis subsp. mobilis ATCC 10988]TQL29475.1 hypothetical protein FBY54_0289 [Zymomonas mobilis]